MTCVRRLLPILDESSLIKWTYPLNIKLLLHIPLFSRILSSATLSFFHEVMAGDVSEKSKVTHGNPSAACCISSTVFSPKLKENICTRSAETEAVPGTPSEATDC